MSLLLTLGVFRAGAEQRVGIGATPDNLVRIKLSPPDLHGASLAGAGGRQNFVYADGTRITVEAPETYKGQPFAYWHIQRPLGRAPEIVRSRRASVTLTDRMYFIIARYGAGDSSSKLSQPGMGLPLPGLGLTLPGSVPFERQFNAAPSRSDSEQHPGHSSRPSFGMPDARRRQLFEEAQRMFGPPVSARCTQSRTAKKASKPAQAKPRTEKASEKTPKTITPEE